MTNIAEAEEIKDGLAAPRRPPASKAFNESLPHRPRTSPDVFSITGYS